MLFPKLTDLERAEIAKQIAELINAFTSEGRLGEASILSGLELHESCPEVILDLPREWKRLVEQGVRIEQWRRPQATWYHQLRTNDQEFGFARSIEVDGPVGRKHRVIEVVPSTVAHEFQEAVRFVDAQESKTVQPGSELSVFLLHVPRYAFYSLAAAETAGPEEGGLNKVILVCPFFQKKLSVAKWRQASLSSLLGDLPDTFGASDSEKSRFPLLSRLLRRIDFF